jgi:xanthine dehydrogenase YagR molybdenum-binding subunit
MASVGSAVRAACLEAKRQAALLAATGRGSPLFGAAPEALEWDGSTLRRRGAGGVGWTLGEIAAATGRPIEGEASGERDPAVAQRFSMHAFGAVFVEVVVDPDVGTIRVRRVVGAYAAGRIVNPLLARSQCIGGMVGGISMALMERTTLDPRDGRLVNAHMADYLMPVNLDVPDLEVTFVDEVDPHVNALGVKGLGEISIVGMAPAVANAVFHATGKRVRSLPIRLEDVLTS